MKKEVKMSIKIVLDSNAVAHKNTLVFFRFVRKKKCYKRI